MISDHQIVSHDLWVQKRKELLLAEKALTKHCDEVAKLRRELPWEPIKENYVFQTSVGDKTLRELFGRNKQLVVYHFMFSPTDELPCSSCAYLCDHYSGMLQHLNARNVSFVAIGHASLGKLEAFKTRMKWEFEMASSENNSFNFDYNVSFTDAEKEANQINYNYTNIPYFGSEGPGLSVFYCDESDTIYHTYSAYARGLDRFITTYQFLDSVPEGRNETSAMNWVKFKDCYN